ncbi:hypothetical protein IKD57_01525 [Candidatus Saccharibacteria bacterium]|nr:hypothetical protein [Candidatus Saccharibacteria bacterium]
MKDEMVLVKFEEMLDSFDENDEICVEDVQAEMHKHWRVYIDAGCDIGEILRMMSPLDVFENYDSLVSRGINLDENSLVNRIEACLHEDSKKSEEFLKENYSWFSDRGLLAMALPIFITDSFNRKKFIYDHIDEIKDQVDRATLSTIIIDCYDETGMEFDRDLFEEYNEAGLDMSFLAGYALSHEINDSRISNELWVDILDSFNKAGAPENSTRQLLKSLSGYFFYDVFFENNQIDWLKAFDDNLAPYIDRIFDEGCFDNIPFRDRIHLVMELPEEIRKLFLKKLLGDEISIRDLDIEILEAYGSLKEFLEDAKLSVDFLVDKFIKEDGYTNCCDDWLPLQLFELAPDKLNPGKIVQKVLDDDGEEPEDLEKIYKELKEIGVGEEVIAPLLKNN